tara:strand:- start:597 stop:1871 length:1275 start_codon:yes stop_codon:yes gene_type:complete
MDEQDWGLQQGELPIDEAFTADNSSSPHNLSEHDSIVLGTNFAYPLDVTYEKIFIGGKTGSGKSYTAGVFMEELSRHGIQFVCFDALDAHSGIPELPNVERISPTEDESINVHKLVYNLQHSNSSLIVNMVNLKLETQQEMLGDYCEALLAIDKIGKPIMTILEECQDFVPQMGRPPSFPPIVRLCKLGRGKGLGATLISQRPAAIHKEALSQVSTYMVHNIINTRDLEALKLQLSFGTDKATIKNIISSISYASPGEMVCFSPKYFKDVGYIKVGMIDRPRTTEHGGKNIEVQSKLAPESLSVYDSMEYPSNAYSSIINNNYGDDILPKQQSDAEDSTQISLHQPNMYNKMESLDADMLEDEDIYNSYDMEWDPHFGEVKDVEEEKSKPPNPHSKTYKAVAAIGLFSTGIFLITRGITKSQPK